jgi:hypothetical protein
MAGKHVVVEKPFTLRSEHAEELISFAREKGVVLTVFQNRRWDGDFLTVREILRSEMLGRLVEFESHFDRYRTAIQDSWKERSTGTGTLYNLGAQWWTRPLPFQEAERLFCDSACCGMSLTDNNFDLFPLLSGFKCLLRAYLVGNPVRDSSFTAPWGAT